MIKKVHPTPPNITSFPKRKKRPVSGWLLFDKPKFMSSTHAVAKIKWLFQAQKAGHAGTLDPLASGLLPIALGEATKIVPYVLEGAKTYRFRIGWGAERTSDDLEGEITKQSQHRPSQQDIEAILPNFIGEIWQTPPKFSAIKIAGKRAYDLARSGEDFSLKSRLITIYNLNLIEHESKHYTDFEICCSKGTYIRALARDMGQQLGCYGHIQQLRRLEILAFPKESLAKIISLDNLLLHQEAAQNGDFSSLDGLLESCDTPLYYMDSYHISEMAQQKILKGQKISLFDKEISFVPKILYTSTMPNISAKSDEDEKMIKIFYNNKFLALGIRENNFCQPKRVFAID